MKTSNLDNLAAQKESITSQTIINTAHQTRSVIKELILKPFLYLITILGLHLGFIILSPYIQGYFYYFPLVSTIELYSYWGLFLLLTYWFVVRSVSISSKLLSKSTLFSNHETLRVLLPFISSVLKIILSLILINISFQYAPVSPLTTYFVNKLSSVLIIIAITWILMKLVDVITILLSRHYQKNLIDASGSVKKINTKIYILKRFVIGLLFLLSVGASLMLFDNVRAIGASVLTTAGIAGLVMTFAAQRSLGSIFGGLEIALSQPIKIGDLVMIENESGVVEEINFRSVIIRLWDLRRLSVPTSYFLEKPFQNWSRENDNLIGSITFFMDFTLPINHIRAKVDQYLNESAWWDKKTGKIQVSDLQEQVMQLKILASASNADNLSKLKSELREKVITYIVKNYPECLPSTRNRNIAKGFSGEDRPRFNRTDEVFNVERST